MAAPARLLILFGLVLVGAGLLLLVAPRVPWLGRLPGDLLFRRGGMTIYVPVVTSILLSIVLTVLLNLFFRR